MCTCHSDHHAVSELHGDELLHTFSQVNSLLQQYQGLWRLQPLPCLSGQDTRHQHQALVSILQQAMPAAPALVASLAEAVSTLSLQQIEDIDAKPAAQKDFFSPWLGSVFALSWLAEPTFKAQRQPAFPFWLTNGIGGRKLGQVAAFIAHTPDLSGTVVEWCAGKGHLGRLLSYVNKTQHHAALNVVSLEWQRALCASGTQLAQQFDVAQTFQHADVLTQAGADALLAGDHALALHACGDLHRTLIEQAVAVQLKSLWVAPCCYHLSAQSEYLAMSQTARDGALRVSSAELKLAVQGQVTAGDRVSALRQTEVTWRLAYQLLRERYADANTYRALPSVAKHWFSGQLQDFIGWACAHHQWSVPQHVDWQGLLDDAGQRYLILKKLDLIRHVFRRPLEMWLALDRALFLREHGYTVSLQAFCEYQMTPRNLLITATLR